jgi:GTP-binding protein
VQTGEVKLLVLLTKADKLNRKEGADSLRKAQEVLGEISSEEADISITLFSALNKTGVGDVAEILQGWAASPEQAAEVEQNRLLAVAAREAALQAEGEGLNGEFDQD